MRTSWTEATTYPVSTTEAKASLHVSDTSEDAFIAILIASATRYFERETSFALIQRTITGITPSWPRVRVLRLPHPPLVSVTSVYYSAEGDSTLLSSDDYTVDTTSKPGRIILGHGVEWPTDELYPPGVTVTYVSGYSVDSSKVPGDIRGAILQLVNHWFENREAIYVPDSRRAGTPSYIPLNTQDTIAYYQGLID